MVQPHKTSNVMPLERRLHWRDRRTTTDRRSNNRRSHMEYDCRSEIPRRRSDVIGELSEGEIWW